MGRAHAAVRSTRRSARSKSAPNWCAGRSAAAGNARTTTSDPDGTAPTRVHRTPTRCRSWRRTRLRTTAPPTPTPTTKPTRGGNDAAEAPSLDERSALSSGGRKCTTTAPAPACRPCRTTTANSVDRRSRLAAGSTGAAAGSCRPEPAAAPVLPAANRLRRSTEFAVVVRQGRHAGAGAVVVHFLPSDDSADLSSSEGDSAASLPPRVGFVVGVGVGGAVVRNRVRRQLRHLVGVRWTRVGAVPSGSLVVVRALPAAALRPAHQLGADLDRALRRVLRTAA